MKNLKVITLAVLLIAGTAGLNAQEDAVKTKQMTKKECCADKATKSKVDRAQRHKGMYEDLDLTDAQKTRIKEIREANSEKKLKLRTELKEIYKAERAEIQKVFTEEQKAKMKERKAQHNKKDIKRSPRGEMKKIQKIDK